MHQDARKIVVDKLDRLLTDSGLLFVGHAELLSMLKARFKNVNHSRAFALTKRGSQEPEISVRKTVRKTIGANPRGLKINSMSKPATTRGTLPARIQPATKPALSSQEPLKTDDRFKNAKVFADQGNLGQAMSLCSELLEENGADPELHHLAGTIHLAGGNTAKAQESFTKALYLDPDHEPSLALLLLLAQSKGDKAKIDVLRKRLNKAANKQ